MAERQERPSKRDEAPTPGRRPWTVWAGKCLGVAAGIKGAALLVLNVLAPVQVWGLRFEVPLQPIAGAGLLLGGLGLLLSPGKARARLCLLGSASLLTAGLLTICDIMSQQPALIVENLTTASICLLLLSVSLASSVVFSRLPQLLVAAVPAASAIESLLLLSWGRNPDSSINTLGIGTFLLSLGLLSSPTSLKPGSAADQAKWTRIAAVGGGIATALATVCIGIRQGLSNELSIVLGAVSGMVLAGPLLLWARQLLRGGEQRTDFAGRWRWEVETDQFWLSAKLAATLGLEGGGFFPRSELTDLGPTTNWLPPSLPPNLVPGHPVRWEFSSAEGPVRGVGAVRHSNGRLVVVGEAQIATQVEPPSGTIGFPPTEGEHSGGYQPHGPPEYVPLGPLLRRVNAGLGVLVERSGIEFRVVDTNSVVISEPVTLERAVRLLLQGAVGMEGNFRLVVGCRGKQNTVQLCVYWTHTPRPAEALQAPPEMLLFQRLAEDLGHVSHFTQLETGIGWASVTMPRALTRSEPAQRNMLALGIVCADSAMQTKLRAMVEAAGYSVQGATDADELVRSLDQGNIPDALILDCRPSAWPIGRERLAAIRAATGWEIPAVLVAGPASAGVTHPERSIHVLSEPLSETAVHAALEAVVREQPWAV